MTTDAEQDEILIRQLLFRHRTYAKKGAPNTQQECDAIRFAITERRKIMEQRAINAMEGKPEGSRTQRGVRGRQHRPTSDGLPREDER